MKSRLFARLLDGDGATEHEALAYIGGGLIGIAAANLVLVLAFGLGYISG
jgi:hypothetical protein